MATLSVIIPCFNNGPLLKEMMDCCIRQTYKDWELIIVDDQSTDQITHSILEEYKNKDQRIKFYIRECNPKGAVVCRNIGFDHSSGKYIIHFDADDLIPDTCFQKRVQFMDANPDCDYATFPAVSFIDVDRIPSWNGSAPYGISKGPHQLLYYFLRADYPFSVWCNIYRKESIEQLPWDEKVKIYTDFSFIVPCIFKGLNHKFSNLKEYDYFYRKFNKGTNMCSNFISQDKCDSTIYLFDKILKGIQERDDKEELFESFRHFLLLHYERLLGTDNSVEIDRFITLIQSYYPDLAIKMRKVTNKTKGCNGNHIKLVRKHLILYKYFKRNIDLTVCTHELAKAILRR